jgi:hypothetical protein
VIPTTPLPHCWTCASGSGGSVSSPGHHIETGDARSMKGVTALFMLPQGDAPYAERLKEDGRQGDKRGSRVVGVSVKPFVAFGRRTRLAAHPVKGTSALRRRPCRAP